MNVVRVDACGQGGVKNSIFCGRHKWMVPYLFPSSLINDQPQETGSNNLLFMGVYNFDSYHHNATVSRTP